MLETTLGQRIAERRKMLGLSQEALGEKLGVSRQAISKWESDSAVPEIDKLIALSRLFSVSIGWLLGTEEDVPGTQSGVSPEEQRNMLEEIVRRYQPTQQESRKTQWLSVLTAGASVLALLLSVISLFKAANPNVPDYQGQLSYLSSSYSNLQGDINYLSDQLQAMAEGEKLLLEYDFTAEALRDLSGAKVRFFAVPNTWAETDRAILSVRLGGKEVQQAECVWDGSGCRAEVELPPANDYAYYFVLQHEDGTQEQQVLVASSEDYYAVNVAEGLRYDVQFSYEGTYSTNYWDMSHYGVDIMLPGLLWSDENLTWEKADLVLYRNGEEFLRTSIMEAKEDVNEKNDSLTQSVPAVPMAPLDSTNPDMEYFLSREHVRLDCELKDVVVGEVIEARVWLSLSNGLTYEETVGTWSLPEYFSGE